MERFLKYSLSFHYSSIIKLELRRIDFSMQGYIIKLSGKSGKQWGNSKDILAMDVKKNPKTFSGYANSKLKTKTWISNLEKEDGHNTSLDKEKTEVLNNFFTSSFTKEDSTSIP